MLSHGISMHVYLSTSLHVALEATVCVTSPWVVLHQVDSGTWSAADILPDSSPGPRAFHSAVAQGGRMLVFGGHILTFDAEQNRKRRNFFNDIWQLHLVGHMAQQS